MYNLSSSVSVLCLLVSGASAFAPATTSTAKSTSTELSMSPESDRRNFISRVAIAGAGIVTGSGLTTAQPSHAFGGGLSKVNARLSSYGLPPMAKLPDGFSPLLEIWGKGRNRFPLLINFAHPLDWVVTLPSQDVNGEDGTIQAGEYAKGDTATLFVYQDAGKVANVGEKPKSFFEDALIKSISQKGANIYQDFKVIKTETTRGEYKDQEYVIVDFKYTLLTGAGFEVQRRGVASVTSVGDAVEVLWTATIAARFKKLEPNLRSIAGSFRCYADGLDLIAPRSDVADDFA
mmetsp:Transcript_37373/g.81827  ORF Transcript_37373/g.81827 Transcript_37373/m.81827 type:complete len:290 (+) Transcript_37373:134-1003(+)